MAICPKTGFVFISDGYGNSRVHKYAPDGRHVISWGEPGTDPGQFNLPHNIATDADGLVYVADRENHRVQIFDGEGRYQGQWNNLHRPCGLYADRQNGDHVYVGELGPDLPVNIATPNLGPRVTVFDKKGARVSRFGDRRSGRSRASSPLPTPSSPTHTATSTWARSPTRRAASTRSRRARSAPSRNSSVSTRRSEGASTAPPSLPKPGLRRQAGARNVVTSTRS